MNFPHLTPFRTIQGLALTLAFLTITLAFSRAQNFDGKLYWANGDFIKGSLIGSQEEQLHWKTDLFSQPMVIESAYLDSITFDQNKSRSDSASPFRATLMSGDVLHGKLESITNEFTTLTDPRHGPIRLRNSSWLHLRRLNHPSLVFLGPNGREGWKTLNRKLQVDFWSMRAGGGLQSKRWRSELYRDLKMPGLVQFEILLRSTERPEFTVAFDKEQDSETQPKLETWDDELVFSYGKGFESVQTLKKDIRAINLLMFWNRPLGELLIHSSSGEQLAKVKLDPKYNPTGFYLRNKGLNLELAKLRISEWNGRPPALVREGQSRIRLVDGSVLYGRVASMDTSRTITMTDGRTVELDRIDTIHFREVPATPPPPQPVELTYPDGSLLSGELRAITDGKAIFSTGYSPDPITSDLNGAREIRFYAQNDVPGSPSDELYLNNRVLRGTLSPGKGDSPIQWMPFGGSKAIPLKPDAKARIIRTKSRAVSNLDGDRLFLNSHEIISCRIESVDDEFVHFRTSLAEVKKMPAASVKAIEFRQGRLQLIGFGDRSWTKVKTKKGTVTREPDRLTIDGGAIHHPSILRADELTFDVKWDSGTQGALTLGMFAHELPDSQPPLQVSFSCWSNRLWVTGSEAGGARNAMGGDDITITNGEAKVKIILVDDRVQIHINGQELVNLPFESKKRLGNGLRFATGGPWFDRMTDLSKAVITNFQIRSSNGLLAPLRVDAEAQRQALTTPRFRRESPDTHILIAPNGDLLRGRLGGITKDAIRFSSRLEEVELPRDRVAGLVYLDTEETELTIEPKEVRVVLSDGTAIRLIPKEMSGTSLTGTSPSLGNCQLPTSAIRQIEIGSVTPIPDFLVYGDWDRLDPIEPEIPDPESGAKPNEMVSQEAPDFDVKLLTGASFKLSEQKGKVTVLEFWATWCGPCARAFPEYLDAMKAFEGKPVRFIAVNQGEVPVVIKPYLKRHNWDFEVALDPRQEIGRKYTVEGIPHTVIIDQQGKIAWVQSGFRPAIGDEFKKVIEGLLAPKEEEPQ